MCSEEKLQDSELNSNPFFHLYFLVDFGKAKWPHILHSSIIVDKHHVANEQREGLLKVNLFI